MFILITLALLVVTVFYVPNLQIAKTQTQTDSNKSNLESSNVIPTQRAYPHRII